MLAFEPIVPDSFEFKLDFAAFLRYLYRTPADLLFLELTLSIPESLLVFSGIVLSKGKNNRQTFPEESAKTKQLETKGAQKHIPTSRLFSEDKSTFAEQLFLNAENYIYDFPKKL